MENKQNKPEKNDSSKAMTKKEDVQRSKDERTDEDFPGYPHSPSGEKIINPKTEEDKAAANLKTKNETPSTDEEQSIGSANAFEATEGGDILREELDDDKDDKNKESYY
jgi:hypothetical protein